MLNDCGDIIGRRACGGSLQRCLKISSQQYSAFAVTLTEYGPPKTAF
jgi:hypothetical protein